MGLEFQSIQGVRMSETIYINGKKYHSVAEMPKNIRNIYIKLDSLMVDENKDGVPDMIQSGGLSGIKDTVNLIKDLAQFSNVEGLEPGQLSIIRETDSEIFINGKTFASIDEMPANLQQEYEETVKNAKDGTEEIFEETWRQVERDVFFDPHDDEILNQNFSDLIPETSAPMEMIDSTNRLIVIALGALLFFGCIAAAWFFIP
jgi:hypothetical protein